MRIALICPSNDPDAVIATSWAKAALEQFSPIPEFLQIFDGPVLTRLTFERAIDSAELLIYYGHGDSAKLVAEEDLLDSNNLSCASGKSVAAIACRSARDLGRHAVSQYGSQGYLGFLNDVLFLEPDPGGVFGAAFSAGAEVLLSGETLESAATAMNSGFDRILDYFIMVEGYHPDAQWGRYCAMWLKRCLVVHR